MNFKAKDEIAALIDHTLLKPEARHSDVVRLCQEAREAQFASVCINPYWVPLAASELAGAAVKVCTVIGFPLGATARTIKVAEAELALVLGARELDVVINIGALRSGERESVETEIVELVDVAHQGGALLKVIFETCLLTEEEKRVACRICVRAGVDFVKTSTGFSTGGAAVTDVALMREEVGPRIGVKASGGVRNLDAVQRMVAAGATRIGTSSGLAILDEVAGAANSDPTGASTY